MELLKLSPDLDLDTEQLFYLFDALSQELSKPFLEVFDISEELADVINQLSLREKDLQAAIAIARMLLDNTIMLKHQNEDLHQQIHDFENKCKTLKKDANYYKERQNLYEEQFEKASLELHKTEKQIHILQQEKANLESENDKLAQESTLIQQKAANKTDELAFLIQSKLETSYAMLNQSYGKVKFEKDELNQEITEVKDERLKLYKENMNLRKELKDAKGQMDSLLSHNQDLEGKIKDYEEDLETLEVSNDELRKPKDQLSRSEISQQSLMSIENELGQLEKNQDEDLRFSEDEIQKEPINECSMNMSEQSNTDKREPLVCCNRISIFPGNLSRIPVNKMLTFDSLKSQFKSYFEETQNSTVQTKTKAGPFSPSSLQSKLRKESRRSTRIAIRKTITEIERQLVNRKSYMVSSRLSNESIFNQSFSHIDKIEESEISPHPHKEFTNFDSFSNVIELPVPEKSSIDYLHSPTFEVSQDKKFSDPESFRLMTIDHAHIISNIGLGSDRSLEEEYFLMLTASAKINSNHLNELCTVSGEKLYEIVKRYNIPFYKVMNIQWHIWIEKVMSIEYLSNKVRRRL